MTEYEGAYPDGTTGYVAGNEASRERAEYERDEGLASYRIREAVNRTRKYGVHGLTSAEFRDLTVLHHGQASAALTNAHKQGYLVRLQERRQHAYVYVTPENVFGRDTYPFSPQGRGRANIEPEEVAKVGLRVWARTHDHEAMGREILRELGFRTD